MSRAELAAGLVGRLGRSQTAIRSLPRRFSTVARFAAVALFLAIVLFSVTNAFPTDWLGLQQDRRGYEGLSRQDQAHAPGDHIPLPVDVFDFYRDRLHRGDRYFLQVQPGAFGNVDKPTAVATFARFYLLPGVLVDDLLRATVVLSWDADPRALGLPYRRIEQAGRQLIFVARIDRTRLGLP
jgi:hypothetical protein